MKKNLNAYAEIKLFLIANADPIQKEATNQHKKYLGKKSLRIEAIAQYQNKHIKAVKEIATHLNDQDTKKGTDYFTKFGEELGREAVQDGLSIEEAIDGTIYLKQAIFDKLYKAKLIDIL